MTARDLPFEHIYRWAEILPPEWSPDTARDLAALLEERDRSLEQFFVAMFMSDPVAYSPVMKQNGTTLTTATELACYKLFGQLCWVSVRIYPTVASGAGGALRISLPFPPRANGSPSDNFQPPIGSGYTTVGGTQTDANWYVDTNSSLDVTRLGSPAALGIGDAQAFTGWYWLATPQVPAL